LTLHVDERGLIVRHDYVAESFGRLRPFSPVVVRVDVGEARWVQPAALRASRS
jgi:hypothetical protein